NVCVECVFTCEVRRCLFDVVSTTCRFCSLRTNSSFVTEEVITVINEEGITLFLYWDNWEYLIRYKVISTLHICNRDVSQLSINMNLLTCWQFAQPLFFFILA